MRPDAAAVCIDARIEAAIRTHDRVALMRLLQRAGVPAGAVMVAPDWLTDPHLNERGFFVRLAAPHIDARPYPGLPVRIDGSGATGWFAAPRLGEHNVLIACERLGWTHARYEAACASGALIQRPPDGPRL